MTITNDGATILKLLEVEHPAAKVLCELADLQDKEVGDGTTSVVHVEMRAALLEGVGGCVCSSVVCRFLGWAGGVRTGRWRGVLSARPRSGS